MNFFNKLKKFYDKKDTQVIDTAISKTVTTASVTPQITPVPITEIIASQDTPAMTLAATSEIQANDLTPWQQNMLVALRQAEPQLSIWLKIILSGIDEADDTFFARLDFLFKALGTPTDEAEDFINCFRNWLADMGYVQIAEFQSELQYRLALALNLEDEEDERNCLMLKLTERLSKTREIITRRIDRLVSSHVTLNDTFWDNIKEVLIMADVGLEIANRLTQNIKNRASKANCNDAAAFKNFMREELETTFNMQRRISAINQPEVVLIIGVNGVGKTTTIAKLAYRERVQGRKVLVAAGDTFRAAAVQQLNIWANRVGADFYSKCQDADPAAVAYEAIGLAIRKNYDVIFIDTAGRLHTKINLMDELRKIKAVLNKKHPGAPHRSILVVDATTGQNAISQTKLFNEAIGVDEIILTKLDGTAKGGVVVAIALQFSIPITFVGLGEKLEDLRPFNGKDFAQALLA
ncbi:Signal recognition particle receptor FtsY [Desulfovibrionales bacterium]